MWLCARRALAGDPGSADPGTGNPGTGNPGSGDPGSGDPGSDARPGPSVFVDATAGPSRRQATLLVRTSSSLPGAAGLNETVMTGLILVVDDNAVQAGARRDILARVGASVVTASGGDHALALLDDPAFHASLGLLITDHLMPGMGGPELVRSMLLRLPGLPILVLSGLPEAEEEYAKLPVVFRLKPCPPGELIRLARHLLGGQSLLSA